MDPEAEATPAQLAVVAGMRDAVGEFYKESGGELKYVQALLHELGGQPVPGGAVVQMLRLDPAQVRAAMQAGDPPKATCDELMSGLARIMEASDTAEALRPKVEKVSALLRRRRAAAEAAFDDAFALKLEERLLLYVKDDEDVQEHVTQVRGAHDEWRAAGDTATVGTWPCVAHGPGVLSIDRVLCQCQQELLTEEERDQFGMLPKEPPLPFLMEKMHPHRARPGPVADRQAERVRAYTERLTGVSAPASDLAPERLARADEHLARELLSDAFQQKVTGVLGDVDLGPAQMRQGRIEALLAEAEAASAAHAGLGSGYEGVVRLAASRAVLLERHAPGAGQESRPDHKSRCAVKDVRTKVQERFYQKRWLPLESNPDVFNQLGRMLGLPPRVEFYEIFGFDPELLSLVPSPCHAALVCFPLTDEYVEGAKAATAVDANGVYFLRQTVPNACGTVALMHAHANLPAEARAGSEGWLVDFTTATAAKTPLQRAAALEEDEALAVKHNQMAEEGDTNVQSFDGSSAFNAVLHFVCYVCVGGTLYELDGLKQGPVAHGPCSPASLLQQSAQLVQKMLSSNADEIRVNMLALAPAQGMEEDQ